MQTRRSHYRLQPARDKARHNGHFIELADTDTRYQIHHVTIDFQYVNSWLA